MLWRAAPSHGWVRVLSVLCLPWYSASETAMLIVDVHQFHQILKTSKICTYVFLKCNHKPRLIPLDISKNCKRTHVPILKLSLCKNGNKKITLANVIFFQYFHNCLVYANATIEKNSTHIANLIHFLNVLMNHMLVTNTDAINIISIQSFILNTRNTASGADDQLLFGSGIIKASSTWRNG